MPLLTFEQSKSLDDACNEMLKDPIVRFAGIINGMGRLVAGGFRPGLEPLESEDKRRMMFMQISLDVSMRKEYNKTLGQIDYIASKRDKVLMVSVPLYDHIVFISAEPHADPTNLSKRALELFKNCKIPSK